jgi:uncharacterized protein (TIGR02217 family)
MAAAFHEVRFPLALALAGSGGPARRTDVVITGSGREERNQRWFHARRSYDVGSGVRTLGALHDLIGFFEERRGRLYGFRFRDRLDWKSCAPDAQAAMTDQVIGTGDGANRVFQLVKTYGGAFAPYARVIAKPVGGTVKLAVGGQAVNPSAYALDATTGILTFAAAPAKGAVVTAGFEFDVPVRFDTDELHVDYEAFIAGQILKIPLIEILPW